MNTSWKKIWHDAKRGIGPKEIPVPTYIFKNNARGGYYYGYYIDNRGKQVQFSCRTKNRLDAQRYYEKKIREIIVEEKRSKQESHQLSTFTKDFVAFCTNSDPSYSPATTAAFVNALRMFSNSVGDPALDEITVETCQRFVYTYQASVHTRRKLYAHLRSAFNFAVDWNKMEFNPFTRFKKPREVQSEDDVMSDVEFNYFLSQLPTITYSQRRFRRIVTVAFETGTRLSEILNLDAAHVNLEAHIITIANSEYKTTKSKRNRVLTLSGRALRAVEDQLSENAKYGEPVSCCRLLFPNTLGSRLRVDTVSHLFKSEIRRVFPDRPLLRFHSLRHSFGTKMAELNVPPTELKQYMGHSSLSVTERYVHPRKGYYPNIVRALGG